MQDSRNIQTILKSDFCQKIGFIGSHFGAVQKFEISDLRQKSDIEALILLFISK